MAAFCSQRTPWGEMTRVSGRGTGIYTGAIGERRGTVKYPSQPLLNGLPALDFSHPNRKKLCLLVIQFFVPVREQIHQSPRQLSHLHYNKDARNSLGKDGLFNKWCWKTCRRMKLDSYLSPWSKTNKQTNKSSKWSKNSNVKPEMLKHIEESWGVSYKS